MIALHGNSIWYAFFISELQSLFDIVRLPLFERIGPVECVSWKMGRSAQCSLGPQLRG